MNALAVSGSQERGPFTSAQGGHLFVGRRRITTSSDQVDNFGQYNIIVLILELVHRIQKAANLGVDTRLGTGTSKVVHDRLNTTW